MNPDSPGAVFLFIFLILVAYGFLRLFGVFGHRGKISDTGSMICPACGTRGEPAIRTRGHLLIEIILWLCIIVPGLIYSIWRASTRYGACPACGQAGMIQVKSPRGQLLVAQFPPTPRPPV